MNSTVKQLLAKYDQLAARTAIMRSTTSELTHQERELCAEGRDVQFQLLLHMSCRAFFRCFNINKRAA